MPISLAVSRFAAPLRSGLITARLIVPMIDYPR